MAHTDNMPIAHWTSADIATTLESFTNKPQYWPELRKSFGQGILAFDLIGLMKNDNNFIASESWKVHEELPPFRTMKIGSTVSGGAAATDSITFNLNADTDIDTYHHAYPRAGQSFWAGSANALYEFVITSVTLESSNATIVAYAKNSTKLTTDGEVPAHLIKENNVFALSPAVNAGQGTAGTTPTHTGYQEFTFYTQILKDSVGWENAEFAREKWFEVQGGKIYTKEIGRMDTNLDAAMEAAIWFGQQTTNTSNIVQTSLATNASVVVPGTVGIWDSIAARGYDIDFTNTTDFTVEHFYKLAEYGETVGLPSGNWLFSSGGDLLRRIEKSCKSYITNATGSLGDMFTPDAGGGYKDLTVGFKHIMIGGQTIILHPNSLFNNPYLFGISTYGIKDAAAVFPLGDVRTKGGGMIRNLSLVYRGLPGYGERKRAFAPFLGTAGPKGIIGGPTVLEGDISKVHATVDFGVQFLEAWRGVRVINTDVTNLL